MIKNKELNGELTLYFNSHANVQSSRLVGNRDRVFASVFALSIFSFEFR